jgi:hypothetical protein
MRRAVVVSLLCTQLLWPAGAHGEEDMKKTCAAAFSTAQRLMRSGSLLEARKKLVLCGGPQCPAVMRPDCQEWLGGVEKSIPTVVFQVSPETLAMPQDVRLTLDDGEPFALDGRAIGVDPGAHTITFAAEGFRPVSRQFVVSEGERLRREIATLEPLPPTPRVEEPRLNLIPPAPVAKKGITVPIIIALSGSALATAGAITFGVKARSDERDLESCYTHCPDAEVSHVRKEYLLTNIFIGVAAVGLATSVVLWILHKRQPRASSSGAGNPGLQLATF